MINDVMNKNMSNVRDVVDSFLVMNELAGTNDLQFTIKFSKLFPNKVCLYSRDREFISIKSYLSSTKGIQLTMRIDQPWSNYLFTKQIKFAFANFKDERKNWKSSPTYLFKTEEECIYFLNFIFDKI